MKNRAPLENALGYEFKNKVLLANALTHASLGVEENNQRLEFLGDAVLDLVIATLLYRSSQKEQEGWMTRVRSSVVNKASLAHLARSQLQLHNYVLVSESEQQRGIVAEDSVLADAFEAMIGAVYQDAGFQLKPCLDLCEKLFFDQLEQALQHPLTKDPKSLLQEYLQGRGMSLPAYRVLKVDGAPHLQTFRVACSVNLVGILPNDDGDLSFKETIGQARSKRAAEQEAASLMYTYLEESELCVGA